MRRWLPELLLLLGVLLGTVLPAASASAATVETSGISCRRSEDATECEIPLKGAVGAGDVLYLTEVADTDVLLHEGHELGRTGFLMGTPFYARFLPRVYSLAALEGREAPVLLLRCKGVIGDVEGLIPNVSKVEVISQERGRTIAMTSLLLGILLLLGLGAGATWAQGMLRGKDYRAAWLGSVPGAVHFITTLLFTLSMLKVLRALVPSVVSGGQLYLWHADVNIIRVWALSSVLYYCGRPRLPESGQRTAAVTWDRWQDTLGLLVLVVALALMHTLFNAQHFVPGQYAAYVRAYGGGYVAVTLWLGAVAAWRLADGTPRRLLRNSLPTDRLFFLVALASSAVTIRDLVVFLAHGFGEFYSHFAACLVLVAAGLRSRELRGCEQRSAEFAARCRDLLRDSASSVGQLRELCGILQKEWDLARVSVVSIIDDQVLALASAGPAALAVEDVPRPIGSTLRELRDTQRMIYARNGDAASFTGPEGQRLSHAFVILPIVRNGRVIAAITAMARPERELDTRMVLILRLAIHSLALEVISALNQAVVDQKVAQLQALAACTSGIVFENTDAWGRLIDTSERTRRVIVTADGLKTTRVAESAGESPLVWNLFTEYKRELYATWVAFRSAFEFVSKDVRGDDFWALSPREFKSPFLAGLGPERAGILLAHFIEKHARAISASPRYRTLGLAGAHVAVGAGEMRIVILGTRESRCVDVDSPYMSRLHRIRGAAQPGSVLVDAGDPAMGVATGDARLFQVLPPQLDLGSPAIFPDLEKLPHALALIDIHAIPELVEIERHALQTARQTQLGRRPEAHAA
jgi:hypothetical protein